MFYIVGLGNPGVAYQKTRHNAGFWVLDALVAAFSLEAASMKKKYYGRVSQGLVDGEQITLLYPETFMNNAGQAVRALVPNGALEQLVVIYDDVDLVAGTLKISYGCGAGGHNGVKSVVETLGTKDFIRIRIGIAPHKSDDGTMSRPAGSDLAQYVLGKATLAEKKLFEKIVPLAVDAVRTIMLSGKEQAMNRFN